MTENRRWELKNSSNTPIFDLQDAFDMYKKAAYDLNVFEEKPVPFHLFNLLSSLTHLCDWIVNDSRFSQEVIDAAKFLYKNDIEYNLVRKLCNRTKHFGKKQNDPETRLYSSALGQFKLGYSPLGNVHMYLIHHDKKNVNALDLCKSVLIKWKAILDNAEVSG